MSRWLPLLVVCALIVAFTQSAYVSDTAGYVQNILNFDRDPGQGVHDFWDFGHLLWRPSGWLLYRAIGGFFSYSKSGEDKLTVNALLIAMNLLATLVTVVLFRSLAGRLLSARWAADFVTVAFLCFHAVLNYLHSGASYVTGLMWLTLSLWAMIRAVESANQSWRFAVLSGAGAALALLFWFPYIIAVPGVLAAALLWPPERAAFHRRRISLAAAALVVAGLLTIAAYCLAVVQLHLDSVDTFRAWVSGSSHGWAQNRRMLRLVTGLPRSFVWMGDEGLLLKRYFFHDPYARVTLLEIAAEFWRVLAFYCFAACVLWVLWFGLAGRRVLLLLATVAVPLLLFAVFVFEPGSSERYLPLYPFLLVASAFALSRYRQHRVPVAAIAAFLGLAICLNVKALWQSPFPSSEQPAVVRALSLQGKIEPNGLIALLSLRDSLYMWGGAHPFDKQTRHAVLPVYDVLEPGNARAAEWKQQFAQRALASLQQGCHVWVSKRVFAARPLPDWGWTEGDDPHLTWPAIAPFFTRFHYTTDIGGADGFMQLEDSAENLKTLHEVAGS
jgi:hypothetical protein